MSLALYKHILRHGDRRTYPEKGGSVLVHYTAAFKNGKVFDSTRFTNKPISFKIGINQTIRAWDIAIPTMSEGEHAILQVPAEFAYGSQGLFEIVPPNMDLIYDIHLIKVLR